MTKKLASRLIVASVIVMPLGIVVLLVQVWGIYGCAGAPLETLATGICSDQGLQRTHMITKGILAIEMVALATLVLSLVSLGKHKGTRTK